MSDLLDEVSEELRRKRLEAFWQENGAWIVAGVILSILCTAGLSFWRAHEYKADMAQTTQLLTVEDTAGKDLPQALEKFAAAAGKNHAVVARLSAAAVYAQRGEQDKAVAIYKEIENTGGIDRALRDLATVLRLQRELDKGDPATLRRELEPLTRKNAVWRYTALEMLALLDAREGDMKDAAKVLAEITTAADAPDDVRARAMTMRELYLGAAGNPEKADGGADKKAASKK
jgi:hypothetical protein